MGAHQSARAETHVWLTPPFILNALGDFDLDPCACSEPRPWPTANYHYTAEDDGLSRDWYGRVYLNPPYGPPTIIGPWLRRMVEHDCGTALIFARTETALFFETVWNAASAVLFLEGRLFFHYPDGRAADNNGGAPSCLVAYGPSDREVLRDCGLRGKFVGLQ